MTDRLLAPRSIAIVGLSDDPSKHGGRVLANLRKLGFDGDIVGVNPRRPEVDGVRVVASLADVGFPPDVVVSAVPAAATVAVVRDAAAAGAGTVIVFAGGFAEAGDDGADLQHALAEAAGGRVRLLGPNSGGVIVPGGGLAMSFLTCLDRPAEQIRPGAVGVVTQSGGTGSYIHNLAAARGGGLAASISTGNEVDLGIADGIRMLAARDDVAAIGVVMETVRDGAAFVAAAREAAAGGRPVVVNRIGRSERGQRLMTTHTGALATPSVVLDGVLDSLAVTATETPEEMLDVAEVLANARRPPGGRTAVITHSGGIAILLSDLADQAGLDLPPMSGTLRGRLAPLLSQGALDNPLDMGGIIGGAHRYAEVVDLFACSGEYDQVLAVSTAHPPAHTDERVTGLLALESPVPIVHLWMAGDQGADGLARLREARRPVTTEPRAAIRALSGLVAAADDATAAGDGPPLPAGPIDEVAAKGFAGAGGIPVVVGKAAGTPDEVSAAADRLGYPVVVKVRSAGLTHKTEVGGVRVGVRSGGDAAQAAREIDTAVRAAGHTIDGFLVEPQLSGPEVIVGAVRNERFGPMVLVGLGGVVAEALADVRMALAPVSPRHARRVIDRLAGLRLLIEPRVGPPADLDALAEIVARVGRLVATTPTLHSLDLNPLIWTEDGWFAVDAVVEPQP